MSFLKKYSAGFLIILLSVFSCFAQNEYDFPVPQVAIEKENQVPAEIMGMDAQTWMYEIPWSWQEVKDYYKSQVPVYGWSLMSTGSNMAAGENSFFAQNNLIFKKGGKTMIVNKIPSFQKEEGVTRFFINIHGKRAVSEPSQPEDMPEDILEDIPNSLPEMKGMIESGQSSDLFSSLFSGKKFSDYVYDVPVYPGAKEVMAREIKGMITGMFNVGADTAAIENFYISKMAAGGWVLKEKKDPGSLGGMISKSLGSLNQDCPECSGSDPEVIKNALGRLNIQSILSFEKGNKRCSVTVMDMNPNFNILSISYRKGE